MNDDINSIPDSDVDKFRCSSRNSEYSVNSSTKTSKILQSQQNQQNQQKNNETGSQKSANSVKFENPKNEQKTDENHKNSTKTSNQPKINNPFSLVPSGSPGFSTAKPTQPSKNNIASLMKQMSAPAGSTSSGVSTGSWKTVAKVANFPKSSSVTQKSKLQTQVKSNRPSFMKDFAHLDERWFNLDYCFNNYKIGECPSGKQCKFFKKEDRNSRYNCPFYHTDEDRRRKIDRPQNAKSQYYYKAISCKHAEVDRGIYKTYDLKKCYDKDACMFAHSKFEIQYHALPWKSRPCKDSQKTIAKCPRTFFCAYKHDDDDKHGFTEVDHGHFW